MSGPRMPHSGDSDCGISSCPRPGSELVGSEDGSVLLVCHTHARAPNGDDLDRRVAVDDAQDRCDTAEIPVVPAAVEPVAGERHWVTEPERHATTFSLRGRLRELLRPALLILAGTVIVVIGLNVCAQSDSGLFGIGIGVAGMLLVLRVVLPRNPWNY